MLPLWSTSATSELAAALPAALPLSAGRDMAIARQAMASARSNSSSHCLSFRRRISLWWTSVRNSSEESAPRAAGGG